MALRRLELSEALGEDYATTFARLQRLFRARGVPAEDAADLAQETATRLLTYLERHGGIVEDPGPLMHRIAINLLIDRSRAADRKVVALDPAEHDAPSPTDVLEEVRSRHRRRVVRGAITSLNDRQRDAIVLSLDGHSPIEIAHRMGLERNAADALLFRARKTLAGRLAHLREELTAIIVLSALKLRSAARRSSSIPGDQLAASAPAFAHFISAALIVVLGGFGGGAPAYAATSSTDAKIVAAQPARHADAAGSTSRSAARLARPRILDVEQHHVHIETRVPGPRGESLPVSIDIEHQRDEVHRGAAGPAMDAATGSACGVRSVENVCTNGGGPR